MLEEQKIRLLQFEYNRGAILSGFLLRNFAKCFKEKGYGIGKLFPNGVLFKDYDYDQEDFRGPNYVACIATDKELIETISIS